MPTSQTSITFPPEFHCIYYLRNESSTTLAAPMWYSRQLNSLRFDSKTGPGKLTYNIYNFNEKRAYQLIRISQTEYQCQYFDLDYDMPQVYDLSSAKNLGNETVQGLPAWHFASELASNSFDLWVLQSNGMPLQARTNYRYESFMYFVGKEQERHFFELPEGVHCERVDKPEVDWMRTLFKVRD
eukprot:CAMPEP_0117442466 /NCGR_PEP_ID=MMETSP0759-20121206/4166_1 /TAXON_ID=63605 /ORGANISM="Percolomonas cosmopolitus, Strain WS" /LENGTH=183 /DNA_ID=CAMNT_0005234355 /DNA_START=83 /DNA_END=634 /DNA_ORIENTATION=+